MVLLLDAHRHRGPPDLDLRAVVEAGAGDAVAVDEHAVGRAEVLHRDANVAGDRVVDHELDVPSAHTGVVDPEVGLGATADDEPGGLQRVAGAVDLEERAGPAYLRVGGVADHGGGGRAADAETADGQVVGGLETDRDRAGEDVALLLGVLLELERELLDQGGVVRREPVDVLARELDMEVVGHHPPLSRQDLGVVVALALEGRGDLDGLHGAAERAGEGTGDHRLEALLELLQATHAAPPLRPVVCSAPSPLYPPTWDEARQRSGCARSYP